MARNVVGNQTPRCARCSFVPRWCICAAHAGIELPLAVDVLFHHREWWRPTSTGKLINRVVPASRAHVYHQEKPLARDAVVMPGRELWILHPRGEPVLPGAEPGKLQLLLLDGSWREAASMAAVVSGWGGRLIRLPETGASRNRLRRQEQPGNYSTVESLLILLEALGLDAPADQLRRQFELHVYAGLRTRGAKVEAAEFLASSSLPAAFPELLRQLEARRPNEEAMAGRKAVRDEG